MRSSLLAAVVVLTVGGVSYLAAAEPRLRPRGKVVRVERPRAIHQNTPLVCIVTESRGAAACFGRPPRPDEQGVAMLSDDGVVGMVRAESFRPAIRGGCASSAAYDLTYTQLTGQPVDPSMGSAMLVFGKDLDPMRAKLIEDTYSIRSPSGRDDDTPWAAIDEDGDDVFDTLVTSHTCVATPSGNGPWCVDYWQRSGRGVERTSQYVVNECP